MSAGQGKDERVEARANSTKKETCLESIFCSCSLVNSFHLLSYVLELEKVTWDRPPPPSCSLQVSQLRFLLLQACTMESKFPRCGMRRASSWTKKNEPSSRSVPNGEIRFRRNVGTVGHEKDRFGIASSSAFHETSHARKNDAQETCKREGKRAEASRIRFFFFLARRHGCALSFVPTPSDTLPSPTVPIPDASIGRRSGFERRSGSFRIGKTCPFRSHGFPNRNVP